MEGFLTFGRSRGRLLAGGAALAALFAWQVPAASAAATSCGAAPGPKGDGQIISGKAIPGDVVVPRGKTCTLLNDQIGGSVTVNGSLQVGNGTADTTTISGNLVTNPGSDVGLSNGVTVVGDTTFQSPHDVGCVHFQGNLTIKNEPAGGGAGVIVSRTLCDGVRGNVSILNNRRSEYFLSYSVGGDLTVRGNTGDLHVTTNNVGGNGNVTNNTGGVFLLNNVFGSDLNCFGNTPRPTGSGNTAQGSLNGQCANLG